jgi:hypothetical protein
MHPRRPNVRTVDVVAPGGVCAMMLAFLSTWQWIVIGGLVVLVIVLLIIKKKQQQY